MVLALGLLFLGVLARFMPHAPNFTPVLAVALFGAVYLKRSYALILPLSLMMVTDIFLGLHPVVAFTWGSILLVSCIGLWVRTRLSVTNVVIGSLASAMLFFVVTNFGVWLTYYPQTWEGFVSCYTLAIPFFRTTLASTAVYAIVMFGGYELLAMSFKKTRLAPVLLNK
ncbi:MAG: DUF6580 family putative transport protein [Candidatus Omnitrophota bacterium]